MYFPRITVHQLREILAKEEPVQLIDVREESDFKLEHISGSINKPLAHLQADRATINIEFPIYLVCKSGKVADVAAKLLTDHGCRTVSVVAGGLIAWKVYGFPLQRTA